MPKPGTPTATATATAIQTASPTSAPTRDPDRPLSWRGWAAIAAAVLAANAALIHLALRRAPPVHFAGSRFEDDFDRAAIGPGWFTTGMHWRIARGELWAPAAKNNPLWLEMSLPRDVVVEFDARSETASGSRPGDIKFEIFGNGRDHASGYVCVFGGWGNELSIIGRLGEHGRERVVSRKSGVEPGRRYHMRVERKGRALRWLVDGHPFLSYDDPEPLEGRGHDRFGFSSWEADVFFDHLRIEPL